MVRSSGTLLIAVLVLTVWATPSEADPNVTHAWINGKVLKIRDASSGSGPYDFNNFMVVKVKRDEHAAYIGDENGGTVVPGPGCVTVAGEDLSAGRPEDLYFPDYAPYYTVKCTFTDLRKVDINAGPGDDSVQVLLSHVPVKIVGGAGDDVLSGSRGDDYIEGACGSDRMSSGGGFDGIYADDTDWCDNNCPPTTDRIICGGGGMGFVTTDGVDIISKSCVQ